ncbi:TIGR02444 family protein [Motilimonas pumila]|uniref:TIGR02444 family protein n=1 Tax=Motilimonas pumila TaxID=2303987 RepID=A0A418YCD5_9GAMM|nr:TIGR02444 family protein [Motilimonas pumila]RJG42183.1 TIGR02444 family protein [Motilimonas pumila]
MTCPWQWPEIERRYHSNSQGPLHALQNTHQCNVNLLLLAIELDEKTLFYSKSFWQQCRDCAEIFEQSILRPLRAVRMQVKQLAPQQYSHILITELGLERDLQQQIDTLASQLPLSTQTETTNLMTYLGIQGVKEAEAVSHSLSNVCHQTTNVN